MFRENDSRIRDRIAAHNLAILRKIAINLINRDQTTQNQHSRASQAGRLE
jgi:predicted transposase YbfD/YdcC